VQSLLLLLLLLLMMMMMTVYAAAQCIMASLVDTANGRAAIRNDLP